MIVNLDTLVDSAYVFCPPIIYLWINHFLSCCFKSLFVLMDFFEQFLAKHSFRSRRYRICQLFLYTSIQSLWRCPRYRVHNNLVLMPFCQKYGGSKNYPFTDDAVSELLDVTFTYTKLLITLTGQPECQITIWYVLCTSLLAAKHCKVWSTCGFQPATELEAIPGKPKSSSETLAALALPLLLLVSMDRSGMNTNFHNFVQTFSIDKWRKNRHTYTCFWTHNGFKKNRAIKGETSFFGLMTTFYGDVQPVGSEV